MASVNLQQMPKRNDFMRCLVARPGYKLVGLDFEALEPKVLAYFSRDTQLLRLYGPAALPGQDVYLQNAARLGTIGKAILATGYDPDAPTLEMTAKAKKECKKERSIAKVLTLSSNYGAGAKKIHKTLTMQGVVISLNEVYKLHRDFWQLYAGIKDFEQKLLHSYRRNDGWITNGRGRPLAIDAGKLKDILNRFVQSTGHDLLMRYIWHTTRALTASRLDWRPFIIDLHDETIVEVREDQAEAAAQIMRDSLLVLNQELGWDVTMTGKPDIGDNLSQIKPEG